jgi:hypothetical protein
VITSILLAFVSLSIVSSAVAFLSYVPVLNIFTGWMVAIGLMGAFAGGFASGRMCKRSTVRKRHPVIPIDRGLADRLEETHHGRSPQQAERRS